MGFLDYETTGTDTTTCRPVSFACGVVNPDGSEYIKQLNAYRIVNPGCAVPKEAAAVHGISTRRARREGISPTDALMEIHSVLEVCLREDLPLVIFNALFDWSLVHREHERLGFKGLPVRPALLDPLVIDRYVDRYRKGKRNLGLMHQHYTGEDLEGAHDALADCVGAVRVMRELAARYTEIGERTPAELQAPQRRMHQQWLAQMNAWRAQRGEKPWEYVPWPGDHSWRS